jgi:hypothetical protein
MNGRLLRLDIELGGIKRGRAKHQLREAFDATV